MLSESDIIQQSRADTCMLRYNQSSVLKLYTISRHVEPPGAVIFSSDDLTIKLNETVNEQLGGKYVAPIKHPKMKLKVKDDGRRASENRQAQVHMDKKLDLHSAPPAEAAEGNSEDIGVVMTGPKQVATELRKQKLREQMLNTNQIPETLEVEEEKKRMQKTNLNNVYKKFTYNANDGEELFNGVEQDKPYLYLPFDQVDSDTVCY